MGPLVTVRWLRRNGWCLLLQLLLPLVVNPFGLRLAVLGGIKVLALLVGAFVLLHRDAVGVCVGVLADSRHLPRHFQPRCPARDLELVTLDLLGHVQVGSRPADWRKLVTEIAVERV